MIICLFTFLLTAWNILLQGKNRIVMRKMNSNNVIFDSAFIGTSDFEYSIITAVAVPWVVYKPVVFTNFSSPSNDFNGMSTQWLTSGMLVYSWFVCLEVWVHSESSFDWTVSRNILLKRGNIRSLLMSESVRQHLGHKYMKVINNLQCLNYALYSNIFY